MKGVQCYELFGGIALRNLTSLILFCYFVIMFIMLISFIMAIIITITTTHLLSMVFAFCIFIQFPSLYLCENVLLICRLPFLYVSYNVDLIKMVFLQWCLHSKLLGDRKLKNTDKMMTGICLS